jgi:class 3 adenylate cyclase/tetratricopeptide (TPR) repeat protein
MSDPVADYYRECEEGIVAAGERPPWLADLVDASAAELSFDTARGRTLVERAKAAVPDGPFRFVLELVELRITVREAKASAVNEAIQRLERLVERLPAGEIPTRARTLHLLAIARMRLGRLELAEDALAEALVLAPEGPIRIRMTDSMAQLLIGQGAWSEAIRTLVGLVARRREIKDMLGIAISAGHLARLHIHLGRPAEGVAIARDALAGVQDQPVLTRLRLHTLIMGGLLEMSDTSEVDAAAKELERLTEQPVDDPSHYLRGYAMMTLARARAAVKDEAGARKWLESAKNELTLPAHVALLRYHEAKISPHVTRQEEWRASFEALVAATDFVSEAEVKTLLLLADDAIEDKDEARMRTLLDRAHKRAMESNNPLWMRWVDEATAQLDPDQLAERIAVRFSGRSRSELQKTTRENCTIIFADLVNFTPRALELAPEDVMETVRGLFELGVPLLTKHRVTPISYMGDGLLAICQGEGHEGRGLAFARDLVARAGRVSRVRSTLANGWPLDLRAGVASGPVVLGTLGTLFKTEFAAIGMPTNLAARLQASSQPGEVMCSRHTAQAASIDCPVESLKLKGFAAPVDACRFHVYTPS